MKLHLRVMLLGCLAMLGMLFGGGYCVLTVGNWLFKSNDEIVRETYHKGDWKTLERTPTEAREKTQPVNDSSNGSLPPFLNGRKLRRKMMKTLLTICLLLMTSVCEAQIRAAAAGSAEALDRIDKYRDSLRPDCFSKANLARAAEENKRSVAMSQALVMGKELFGTGVGWEDTNYDGTLARKAVKAYKIDDWGYSRAVLQVVQIIDEDSLLAMSLDDGEALAIKGFSTTRVKDDAEFILPHPIVITRTWSYETVSGGKKTVLVLDRDDKSVENRIAIAKEKQEHERLLQEVMKDKNKIIAEYIKPGAIGTAAYDEFPSSIRERLVREWQEKFDALAEAIDDSEALLRNAASKNIKNNQNKKLSALRAELGKHRLNRPLYVTPETLLILVAMK